MGRSRLIGLSLLILGAVVPLGAQPGSAATAPAHGGRAAVATVRETARPERVAHPIRPPHYHAPAISRGEALRLRTMAAASALRSARASTCSGQISADTLYSCTSPSGTGTDTYTLTLSTTADALFFQVLETNSFSPQSLPVTVTAPDGSTVTCQEPIQIDECTTNQAGTYTLAILSSGNSYTLEYTALLSEPHCPTVTTSFAASVTTGSTTPGQTGNCYSLNAPAGHVLHANSATSPNAITVGIYDSTGTQVCVDDQGDCTLTGTAPYRVFVNSFYGEAENYQFALNDITNPAGCLATPQQEFGQVPAASADLCRALTVMTAGQYQIYAVDASGQGFGTLPATLYLPDGTVACTTVPYCQLAAGTYSLVTDQLLFGDQESAVFIAAGESRGCTATNDTGFSSGDATGTFSGAGEEICRSLPTAPGLSDYLFDQPVVGNQGQVLSVVDATGAQLCSNANGSFTYATCALMGTAPFRVILIPAGTGSSYRLLVQRTDSTAGCTTWPQSGFGGAWGGTVKLTATVNVGCLTIPAALHSSGEMIDYANLTNSVDGAIYVNDPAGNQVCVGNSLSFCPYQHGVTYTALVITTNARGDTYRIVRRDVSSTASCSTPASTALGGPSTTFTLTSDLDTVCYRVTAAAADKFLFDVRTLAPSPAGAVLAVTDPSGKILCRTPGGHCTMTGYPRYQIIVDTSAYAGAAVTAHLDTWLVADSSGWVSQCRQREFSAASGWGPLSGTLTEHTTAYCALVDMQRSSPQIFDIAGIESAPSPGVPDINVFTTADWGQGVAYGLCFENSVGEFDYQCGTTQLPSSITQGILILGLGGVQSPTTFSVMGGCEVGCTSGIQAPAITSVTPPSQPASPRNTVVVTGTNLSPASTLTLTDSSGNTVALGTTESANASGTSLTVGINTGGVTPGTYTAQVTNFQDISASATGTYTISAAPPSASTLVSVVPARVLDTRTGLGAPKARVPADGTLTFRVTGTGGVPTTRVRAVVLDVTAFAPPHPGHLTVFAAGDSRPAAKTLEFGTGQTMSGLVTVPVTDGRAAVYNASLGPVDVAADVVGYDTSAAGGTGLTTTGPARILSQAPVAADSAVAVKVTGVPATGVTTVALNVTTTAAASSGHIVVYADGTGRPDVRSLSYAARQQVTGLVLTQLKDGKVDLYNAARGPVDLTADVVGYYSPAGSVFHPVDAARVLDTRSGLGGAGQTILPHAAAQVSVLGAMPVPYASNVTAVVLNVTVLSPQQAGTLTVFEDNGGSLPAAPNLSFAAGQDESNLVIVPVGSLIDFFNNSGGSAQVVADLEGYYTS